MGDHHLHHHLHRPNRLSLPQHPTTSTSKPSPYPYPFPPSTPTPTPSKHRLSSKSLTKTTSLPFLFLLLFSLRSLYSLLPFLRSSPTFSLFPFTFLVSLLSLLLTLAFSLLTHQKQKIKQPFFSLSSLTKSQLKNLISKSLLLSLIFLLRFQALRYCGAAAMILAELSGNLAAKFISQNRKLHSVAHIRGVLSLFGGLFLLSVSWDRIECFPNILATGSCVRIWPMVLPFSCGFLGCSEKTFMNVKELGRKRVRLISLFFATVILFVPAVVSMFVYDIPVSVSVWDLGWPLANTVVFGVLLSENFTDGSSFRREFFVTFVCTVVLELFYFPELSLWGLLICGGLLGIAVRELDPVYSSYLELGLESSDSIGTLVMRPVRHILSERKSRKIALFLLINTSYMFVEFIVGFMSNSLGLISDACHMLFDCAALAIGLYASYISRLPANGQYNYGRGRFEVLSGYVNAVFLVLVGVLIVVESLERILDPQEISTSSLLTVSIGGLVVNVVGLIFFHDEHHHAHGGSGPCSHSHPHHSHSHSHSHHDHHDGHADKVNEKHHDSITVIHECDEKSTHDHHDCHHHHGNEMGDTKIKSSQCHDHDHHNHGHQHDHHDHDHHDHGHQHDHHDHDHHAHETIPLIGHTSGDTHALKEKQPALDKPSPQKHHHIDHNMEGIFLHVLADTLGSVGVVVSTLLIQYKGWLVADPACSIFLSILIISSVIPLLRNSAEILLQRVPKAHEHDLKEALNDVIKIKGVCGVRNLHFWSFTNTDVVGSLHLHVSTDTDKASAKALVSDILRDGGVKDLTIQVECVKNS